MGWFILAQLFSILIALVSHGRLSEWEKELEILLLYQQVSILLRNRDQPVRATRVREADASRFHCQVERNNQSFCQRAG